MDNLPTSEYHSTMLNKIALLVLLGCAACAAPNSAWVAGGRRSAEVGVLAPVRGTGRALEVEASVERRESEETRFTPGKLRPCDEGHHYGWDRGRGNKHGGGHPIDEGSYSTEDYDEVLGRLGLRLNVTDWAHLALGATDELGAYARLGISKQLTPNCSIGVDLLSDRGEEVLFGLRWSR